MLQFARKLEPSSKPLPKVSWANDLTRKCRQFDKCPNAASKYCGFSGLREMLVNKWFGRVKNYQILRIKTWLLFCLITNKQLLNKFDKRLKTIFDSNLTQDFTNVFKLHAYEYSSFWNKISKLQQTLTNFDLTLTGLSVSTLPQINQPQNTTRHKSLANDKSNVSLNFRHDLPKNHSANQPVFNTIVTGVDER